MAHAPTLAVVLGDQLSPGLSALAGLDPAVDRVLMMEVWGDVTAVPHHRQKVAMVLAAMRHFAAELTSAGFAVDYVRLDDPANTGSFRGEVGRAVARHRPGRLVATRPGDFALWTDMAGWPSAFGLPLDLREDDRFLCPSGVFRAWAAGRRLFRMEDFYRMMRRRTGILMEGSEPVGGTFNLDRENRRSLPPRLAIPKRPEVASDAVADAVADLVRRLLPDGFGDIDGLRWPVTRAAAEAAFEAFVTDHLPCFGDYQDAMRRGDPFLFHALVSPALNIGLLDPYALVIRAEKAFRSGAVPLNAAEGFIRQILGWREYVRGIHELRMPDYARTNALGAARPLPAFYWTGETDMACMAEAVGSIRSNAYAHHIQRLMVTGNYALLAGLAPAEVERWYLSVFADAFEWVELPNTHGMALYADGGFLASKPYAASGAYINRMSDYCASCRFDPARRHGEGACPMTILYWDFLDRHRDSLTANPRMALPLKALAALPEGELAAIRKAARDHLDGLSALPRTVWDVAGAGAGNGARR